jgi:hypothetical protein
MLLSISVIRTSDGILSVSGAFPPLIFLVQFQLHYVLGVIRRFLDLILLYYLVILHMTHPVNCVLI